jgi:Zn-dependent peptidase ImmA (M78 family)
MRGKRRITEEAITRGIEWAKRLVESHSDPAVPPGERLREIAKKLNVSRIEPGAVRADGFLKRLADGSFAVYYSNDSSLAKRRFTVAHELAHLVLEKYHRHVGREPSPSEGVGYHHDIERAVERIAAELLMPEPLVVGLITTHCQDRRQQSASQFVQKRAVLQAVGQDLGVSEYALVLRLLELRPLLTVWMRVRWSTTEGWNKASYAPTQGSQHSYLRVVNEAIPDPRILEEKDGWEHLVPVQTRWGLRIIRCHGWRRPASCTQPGVNETWIIGWTSNTLSLPAWDDSAHEGGTPDVSRVREFDKALAATQIRIVNRAVN